MRVLQMLYHFSKTPTRSINLQVEVRCLLIPKCQFATVAETSKENTQYQKIRRPRKMLAPILIEELGLKRAEVAQFYKDGALEALDKSSLRQRMQNLREMGFEDEEIKSELTLLLLPVREVILRKAILEECGLRKITTSHLYRFEVLMRRRIGLFKDCGYIPSNLNVLDNILSYSNIKLPPPNIGALRKKRNSSPSETVDALPLGDLHKFLVLHYIAYNLEDSKILKKRRLFESISLRSVIKAFDFLRNLNVSKKQMRTCLSLTRCDPENVQDLICSYPTIGGEKITKMIQKHPKIAFCTPSDVGAVLRCIKKFEFDEKTIPFYPAILTANVNVLEQGLLLLRCLPDLWALRHCDGILRLLCQKNLVSKLQYFKSLPHKVVPTVTLLTSGNAAISRILHRGSARKPVLDFLRLLSVELNTDVARVKSLLCLHPHWRLGSASEMLETLTLLRSYRFKEADILENLQIVLYSRSYVQSVLDKIIQQEEESTKYVPGKTDLALCLYYIEREHHFTGTGITKGPESVEEENRRLSGRCKGRPCRKDCLTNPRCGLRIHTNPYLPR